MILLFWGFSTNFKPFFSVGGCTNFHPIQMVNPILSHFQMVNPIESTSFSHFFPLNCAILHDPYYGVYCHPGHPGGAPVLLRLLCRRRQRGQRHLERLHLLRHHAAQAGAKGAEEGQVLDDAQVQWGAGETSQRQKWGN